MRRQLRHCGRKIAAHSIYSLQNAGPFSQLLLFVGPPCPHCGKIPVGHAGLDIWGRPVLFLPDGTPWIAADNDGNQVPSNLSRLGMASKRQTRHYLALIESGVARKIPPAAVKARAVKPGLSGLSEYSRRAAGRNAAFYVLGIQRIAARS
jgi:hypothetical protein